VAAATAAPWLCLTTRHDRGSRTSPRSARLTCANTPTVPPVQPVAAVPRPKRPPQGLAPRPEVPRAADRGHRPGCDKLVPPDAAAVSHVQAVKEDA
jgi:hypothetical protein